MDAALNYLLLATTKQAACRGGDPVRRVVHRPGLLILATRRPADVQNCTTLVWLISLFEIILFEKFNGQIKELRS